jgi:hypothetical protein
LSIFIRGDRTFDERDVVRTALQSAAGFGKVRNFDPITDGQQFIFGVQERQLAAVAGREFKDGQAWLSSPWHHNDSTNK